MTEEGLNVKHATIPPPVYAMARTATSEPRASVDVATVVHRFNWEWAMEQTDYPDLDTYWWWARSVRVDPSEVIADDGEGNLWSIPFETDGADQVTFGQPVRVRETFVPVAEGDGAAASAVVGRRRQRVLAAQLDRPDKQQRPTSAAQAADNPEEEASSMTDEQRRALALSLGLPEDSDEDAIHAAATQRAEANTDPEGGGEGGQPAGEANPEGEEGDDPIDAQRDQELAAATARIAELEADRTARVEAENRSRRDGLASGWVREGRIAPSERDHYRSLLDVDEQRTVALASTLSPGRIPVVERGSAASGDDTARHSSLQRAAAGLGLRRKQTTEVS